MKVIIGALCIFGAVYASQVRFDGFVVHRVIPTTKKQVDALRALEENNIIYDFWTDLAGTNSSVDIMVPPSLKQEFQNFINIQKLDEQVIIENVQERIDNERQIGPQARSFGWTSYHRLNVIYQWLDQLAANHNTVTRIVAGHSYEGRQIRGVRVSFSPNNVNNSVFFECGIHAREWISPAACTFMLNEIVNTNDAALRNYDWYVFPVFNPDGYEFTHTNNRMWRKTRTPYGSCFGADPNRNWAYQWNTLGASNNPCSDIYAGPSPFSERSTRDMSRYISSIQHRLVAYLSFHSFSQMFLIPYGHTAEELDNFAELYQVGLKAAESLAVRYGTQYRVGNIVSLLYFASGGSVDWVKGTHGTRITYAYELRDTGLFGFILPPDQIVDTSWETFDSVKTILEEFRNM